MFVAEEEEKHTDLLRPNIVNFVVSFTSAYPVKSFLIDHLGPVSQNCFVIQSS